MNRKGVRSVADLHSRLAAISRRLKEQYGAQIVILYGSYARGEANEDSDVDLLVVAPTTEDFFRRMATARRLIRDLRHGIAVSPIVLTPEEFAARKAANDPFVETILQEGLSL